MTRKLNFGLVRFRIAICALAPAFLLNSLGSSRAEMIAIDMVLVGDPGNPNSAAHGYGGVSYEYRIGTYEVTNAQYVAFLNAVAKTDANGLYHASMGSNTLGGITQSGVSGNFAYEVKTGMGNKPVNFVSFWNAARFTNWLHNGQPTGLQNNDTTEDGAYTLTASGMTNNSIIRNDGATWFLPNENEWYKAAYYDPDKDGGVGGYWLYPTGTDAAPTAQAPPGGSNSGNFNGSLSPINLTDVGSYVNSISPYGTYDQGGNVWDWLETIDGTTRVRRGGAYNASVGNSSAQNRSNFDLGGASSIGFRVAATVVAESHVPEPSSLTLAGMGLAAILLSGMMRSRTMRRNARRRERIEP